MNRTARLLAAACIAMATIARAGGPLGGCNDPAHTPIKYPGAGTITLNYDLGTLGSRTKLQADAIVSSAVAVWTNVSTASVTIGRGADLPVDVNSANYLSYYNKFADGLFPVIYDSDGSIIDLLLGVGSKSSILGFAGSGFPMAGCFYTEGQAVINGFPNVSDTTLGAIIAHEVGHLIGMDHTQLDNVQGIASPGNYPLMYPILDRASVSLHEDDAAAVSALYPDPTASTVYGEINGTFVLANGVTPVKGANLWASETTTLKVYSIISDFRKQGTGFFRLLLPAGTYNLHAGTLRTTFVGGSGMGPYASSLADLSFQPPLYVSGVAMPNVTLGGNVSPTSFAISPGCVATLTFRLDGTGTVGGNCVAALTVAISGTGSGTVTSSPAGINCSVSCSSNFAAGSSVTLTATPAAGSIFQGWGGACAGAGSCTVTMNAITSVTASFSQQSFNLAVVPIGPGNGTITSSPSGVDCGSTCSAVFNSGTAVTLTATPAAGSTFSGWSGAGCGGTGTCLITMIAANSVTAAFITPPGTPVIGAAIAGNAQASIAFTVPVSNGGAAILDYTVTCVGPDTVSVTGTVSPINVLSLTNGQPYSCSVSARNVGGSGPASGGVSATPQSNAAIAMTTVQSRKFHGAQGACDIQIDANVPIGGAVTVEPRFIGSGHHIVFQFNNSVQSPGAATTTSGNVVVTANSNEVTVILSGISDQQRATVSLNGVIGVNGTTDANASIGFLVGDVNSSHAVNASDISAVKAHSGSASNIGNCRFDLSADGGISSSDIAAVKARSGLTLP